MKWLLINININLVDDGHISVAMFIFLSKHVMFRIPQITIASRH